MAACVTTRIPSTAHITTPVLQQCHWLPVKYTINSNILFKSLSLLLSISLIFWTSRLLPVVWGHSLWLSLSYHGQEPDLFQFILLTFEYYSLSTFISNCHFMHIVILVFNGLYGGLECLERQLWITLIIIIVFEVK